MSITEIKKVEIYYLIFKTVNSVKDMQELLMNIQGDRNWFIKAVRSLLNFAEEREELNLGYI